MVPALLLLFACKGDGEITWVAFNWDQDRVEIEVTDGDVGEPVTADLHSTTGNEVVGSVSVDPGSGPVGTDHTVVIEVFDDWQEQVDRATTATDAGDRGATEHEMVRDSADHGLWQLVLRSLGEEGETRTDTFTFRLYEAEGAYETGD